MPLTGAEKQARYEARREATLGEAADLVDAVLGAIDRGGASAEVRGMLRRIDPAMDVRAALRDLKAVLDGRRLIVCRREGAGDG